MICRGGFSGPTVLPLLALLLAVILGLPVPITGRAEGVRDFAGGWLLTPQDTAVILSGPGPGGLVAKGESTQQVKGWGLWGGAGQGLLYSMRELPLISIESGVVRRGGPIRWAVACSWERLGEELMVEETGSFTLRLGGNPQFGVRVRTRRWLVATELVATSSQTDLEARFTFRLSAVASGNIAFRLPRGLPPEWHGRGGRRTLAEIKLFHPGWGLAFRMDQRGDGVPVLSLGAMGRLTTRLGLGVQGDPETGSMGGNLVVQWGGLWLSTSHQVHPALGLTHRFHLGAGDPEACVR